MWIMSFAEASARPPRSSMSKAPQAGAPGPDDEEFEDEDEVSVADEIGETMTLLMPWAISFMFHFALVLLALFVVWSSSAANEGETTVPVSKINKEIKPKVDPMKKPDLPTVPNITRKVRSPTLKKGNPLSDPSEASPSELSTIGASGSPSSFGHPAGTDNDGVGFMGMGGSASTVVYVVDASGSMVESLPFVINKLKESIRGLKGRAQRFTVIFYQQDSAIEVADRTMGLEKGLKKANAENKGKTQEWLRQGRLIPRGSSNPTEAIKLALSYKPDMIFILSDNITGSGQYAIFKEDLLNEISTMNGGEGDKGGKTVKINTIQFLSDDPLNTLEEIAKANDGQYKFINAAFVGLE